MSCICLSQINYSVLFCSIYPCTCICLQVVKAPFTSLLSIHAFVRRGDHAKQLPLVFVCMFGKRTQDYVRVLQAVGRMVGGEVVVVDFVVDFEVGLWAAIREVFQGASIRGCSFHWGQAVWRNVVVHVTLKT
ncbi:hypothetical protein DPMN_086826 [Dreissena polymorpha]|uniref:MULE transposase domain-containing protein n=1 Tax=Dreissena polymorpha TaxID=45954 RepID=A0A9D4KR52_DREPO|nr:hypothetical protein DPMN_086826 [Dreissena polymorpha]